MLRYIFSLFTLALAFGASAETVTALPGQLKDIVNDPAKVTSLEVKGSINASDLSFIDAGMPALRSLDLSTVEIVASEGSRIGIATHFQDNTIPANVFAGSQFTDIKLPVSSGLVIESGAFAGSRLRTVTIGENVAAVGDGAFAGCPDLTEVTVCTANLGKGSFSECPALEKVSLTVHTSVPEAAFYNCSALATVNGSENIDHIGARAFAGCAALSDFKFSEALRVVADHAFEGAGLKSAMLDGSYGLESVGAWSFANMPHLEVLNLGAPLALGEGVAFNCPNLKNVIVSDITELPAYAYAKDTMVDSVGLIPSTTTTIGAYALSDLTGLTGLTIPEEVEYIGDRAMQRMTSLENLWVHSPAVPELGSDVWAGVDQSKVLVSVRDRLVDAYKAAEQWQEFTIVEISGINDAVADSAESVPGLKARFVGAELQVSVNGVDIETLGLYDTTGRLLVYLEPADGFVAVDTTDFPGAIFIVSATLADGRQASAKVRR